MSVVANRRSVMSCFSSPIDPECHRARIVLAEKDITVEIHDVDTNNLPEDLLDLNPYATVPTMVDRDLVLYNARVLIEYLDERFPHPPLMPVDPVSRAKSRLALFRIESDWFSLLPDIERLYYSLPNNRYFHSVFNGLPCSFRHRACFARIGTIRLISCLVVSVGEIVPD